MSKISVVHWAALGASVVAACNGEAPTSASAEPLRAPRPAISAPAGAADQGSAGEPPLSDAELERLLDALEQELGSR